MAGKWKKAPFDQLLIEPIRNGLYKAKNFHGRGTKIVNMGELFAYPRLSSVPMRRVELNESETARFLLKEGDLIFARRSLTAEGAGKCSVVLELDEPTTFESSIIRARPDRSKVDPLYIYYFFNSPVGFHSLDTIRRQVAVAGITGGDLARLEIPVPPLAEQNAIAHILGTLDDKIELNRRRSQTLEAMARALFQDWFVDFGPIRAKIEGREPYLPSELWDLFPSDLDASGKPKGWRLSTIGDEVDVCGGSTPSTTEPLFWEGGIHHWATPKDLSDLASPVLLNTNRKVTAAGLAKISSGLLPVGSVLLSSRAPIGYLAISEVPVAINQGFIGMRCSRELPSVFVLFWCGQNMDLILGNANGSTFQEISKKNFRPIPVVVPHVAILEKFKKQVEPLYRHIVENEQESQALIQLRDSLVPKLVSGELRVADAETFLERARL